MVICLPGIAVASSTAAFHLIGQIPGENVAKALADKNLAYWFITLAALSIGSWTFFGKWLLDQLYQQRAANQLITTELIGYMKQDHALMISTVTKLSDILERVIKKLDGA